jgi:hypothetical protein
MRTNPVSLALAFFLAGAPAGGFAQESPGSTPTDTPTDTPEVAPADAVAADQTAPLGTEEGSGTPLPEYDPEAPPWEAIENSVVIPAADLSEDAERSLADEFLTAPTMSNRTVARGFGSAAFGAMVSERDGVGPLLMLMGGVARVPWGPPPSLTETHEASESWVRVDAAMELGLASDPDLIPWLQAQLRGPRLNRAFSESEDGTVTLRRDMVWGNVRTARNMRVRRGVRLDAGAGAFELRTAWFERSNVATIVHVAVDLPGYTYVSAQGRADAFHGLSLTRVAFDVGPRFGAQQGPWARFVVGASGATAAGAELGPTASFRTDLQVFTGLDVQAHERFRVIGRLAYDSARDSYRKIDDGAWFGQIALVTLY